MTISDHQTGVPSGQERARLRRFYGEAWQRHRAGLPLEPLERLVAAVIQEHPEYHALLGSADYVRKEFPPENGQANPFLHMGLHVAIREQVGADRPAGIRRLYQSLLPDFADAHTLEHQIMECMADGLWQAQRAGGMPDEAAYLECVRGLGRPKRG